MAKCCICGREIDNPYGENNPTGAAWKTHTGEIELPEFGAEDVCCNECNSKYVIPGRIYRMNLKEL